MRSRPALVPLVALVAGLGLLAARTRADPPKADGPADKPRVKLAVLVVFDQMRGDFLARWKPLFTGGFARMQADGAWFKNCYYPYGLTTTGPGHASMLTGTCPDRHGITNNTWYDRAAAEDVYCATHPRYKTVPPAPRTADDSKDTSAEAKARAKGAGTPDRLLSETVADVLKRARGPRAKVFGLSLKERSAILPTGRRPDGAFWFEGRFVTSDYYADALPPWADAFNRSGAADRWFGKDWTKLRPDLDYAKYSGPDDAAGEGRGTAQGKTFPHPITGGKKAIEAGYYTAMANSPYGSNLLLEFARACVTAEELGKDDVPDLLVVSFSSNDLIGHTWGPDSQEVLDITLRSDALMGELLGFLDERVGKGNYVVAVTADHGICPLPEVSAARGIDAKRVDPKALLAAAESHLKAAFGGPDPEPTPDAPKARSTWVEHFAPPWVYINPRLVKAAGKTPAETARSLADHLAKMPEVHRAFTREELAGEFPADDAMGRRVKRSFHPDRSGDVYVVLKPYHLLSGPLGTGTNHGTPHDYDAHVPLLVYGPGIPGGPRDERVTPQATAAIFARFLGVPAPKDADFPAPATLEGK